MGIWRGNADCNILKPLWKVSLGLWQILAKRTFDYNFIPSQAGRQDNVEVTIERLILILGTLRGCGILFEIVFITHQNGSDIKQPPFENNMGLGVKESKVKLFQI